MRWRDARRSTNVVDVRGRGGKGVALGLGGTIAVVAIGLLLGVDPRTLLGVVGQQRATQSAPPTAEENEQADFVSAVLGTTEDTFSKVFPAQVSRSYEPPKLVLFTGRVDSACGSASSAIGPFYCPGDRQVYLDLAFFDELSRRFGAPGDFARAYVVAHEVGHHVQKLLGTSDDVHRRGQGLDEAGANALSVRLELQADCLAGLWAHHAEKARPMLERGDVEEALGAATAIGDDTLQRNATGHVVPDSFTHGTSAQRARWFRRGLDEGTFAACDTFGATSL